MKILRKRGEMNNREGAKFTHLADFSPHICSLPIFFVLLALLYVVKWPIWHFVLFSAFWATDFVMFTWFCLKKHRKSRDLHQRGTKISLWLTFDRVCASVLDSFNQIFTILRWRMNKLALDFFILPRLTFFVE